MTFLLDVNVLIALLDPMHVSHETAHHWFSGDGGCSWATCPITENAVVRIVGHNRYPNSPGSPTAVAGLLRLLRERPGHVFWADDVSLLDPTWFQPDYVLNHGQVTDAYLLGLAVSHGGTLASLDRPLCVGAVNGGQAAFCLVG